MYSFNFKSWFQKIKTSFSVTPYHLHGLCSISWKFPVHNHWKDYTIPDLFHSKQTLEAQHHQVQAQFPGNFPKWNWWLSCFQALECGDDDGELTTLFCTTIIICPFASIKYFM